MAFFGLTSIGYQEPFQARRLNLNAAPTPEMCERKAASPSYLPPICKRPSVLDPPERQECREMCLMLPEPGPWIHRAPAHGSFEKFQEAKMRGWIKHSPNQLYRVPLTASQGFGWWMPQEPGVRAEMVDPWIRTPHHPMISSPMTKFVDQMTKVDRTFSLF
ncbi:sperm microtubule inner protein 11 [Ambystoma mexicanum]|uniref:sperm microtubule inner protein 11 n=1 Tax=Ambystoma mexicanum TaxID=8296 RepID=UPI0037E7256D